MKNACIAVTKSHGIAEVTLDRKPANAIDLSFAEEMLNVFTRLQSDGALRAIVLTGAGKVFCAGLDLKQVPTYDRAKQNQMLSLLNQLFYTLYSLAVPTVAAINGHAIAGGLVLALACDRRVAVQGNALLGLTEVTVGVPYPVSAIAIVRSELAPAVARQLILGGENRGPTEALALGIVDELQPADQVLKRSGTIAGKLATAPSEGYWQIKRQLRQQAFNDMARAVGGDEPLLDKWLLSETPDAASRVLRRV